MAIWCKYLQNEKQNRDQFVKSAEAGVFVKRGLSKNLISGKTRGQQRPIGTSSL